MSNTPNSYIFFGYYLGNEGVWAKDADYTELPQVVLKDNIPTKAPVRLVIGGSFENGSLDYSLAVKASLTSANWNSNPMDLANAPIMSRSDKGEAQDYATLREWAVKLGISWEKIVQANPSGPRWLIVTSLG